jgi:hypothetical protein
MLANAYTRGNTLARKHIVKEKYCCQVVQIINRIWTGWAEHEAHVQQKRSLYKVLVGKPEKETTQKILA